MKAPHTPSPTPLIQGNAGSGRACKAIAPNSCIGALCKFSDNAASARRAIRCQHLTMHGLRHSPPPVSTHSNLSPPPKTSSRASIAPQRGSCTSIQAVHPAQATCPIDLSWAQLAVNSRVMADSARAPYRFPVAYLGTGLSSIGDNPQTRTVPERADSLRRGPRTPMPSLGRNQRAHKSHSFCQLQPRCGQGDIRHWQLPQDLIRRRPKKGRRVWDVPASITTHGRRRLGGGISGAQAHPFLRVWMSPGGLGPKDFGWLRAERFWVDWAEGF